MKGCEFIRYCDISKLPTRRMRGKDVVNWVNSIGLYIPFEYDDIIGNINILDCPKRGYITIEYNTKHHIIRTEYILNCNLGKIVGKKDASFKYNIGDIVDCGSISYRIIDREKVRRTYSNGKSDETRYYDCICLKCNSEVRKAERSFNRGAGCPVCGDSVRTVVCGVNSIEDEAPHLIKFLANKDDAKNNTKSSTKYVNVICPHCGKLGDKKFKLNALYKLNSIKCTCGDGFSISEKIFYEILTQQNIEFVTEYSPIWAGKYRYDFFIPKYNLIVEMDGEQHYKEVGSFKQSLEEVKARDALKSQLCTDNRVDLVRIDCRVVSADNIISQMINSELFNFIDLNTIDIKKCSEYSTSNIIKEICQHFSNNLNMSIKDIAFKFNLRQSTIKSYIRKGIKYGWCRQLDYESRLIEDKKLKMPTIEVWQFGSIIYTHVGYPSELSKVLYNKFKIKIDRKTIEKSINNKVIVKDNLLFKKEW